MAIVCNSQSYVNINPVFVYKVKAIYITDYDHSLLKNVKYQGSEKIIAVYPLAELASQTNVDVVYYHHIFEPGILANSTNLLRAVGFESFYMFMPIPHNQGMRTLHTPDYFQSNKAGLEFVYDLLAGEDDRAVFASRVRAIETGNIGYLQISKYTQYFHPVVRPEEGDVIIDGGVSERVGLQIQFSKAVGEQGKIFGFEPDPIGFNKAAEALEKGCPHNNYKLVPFGLWRCKDTLSFDLKDQGTHISSEDSEDALECEVISIDAFLEASRVRKLDYIKLDVEGAEAEAIMGAVKSISSFTPKLAISLYHAPRDLYYLPRLITEVSDKYTFYMGHHHPALYETVLYAAPK